MRRLSVEEQIRKERPVINNVKPPVCGVCGSELEFDEDSGQYRCPTCDTEDVQ